MDFHAYDLNTGDPGKLSYAQYVADEDRRRRRTTACGPIATC